MIDLLPFMRGRVVIDDDGCWNWSGARTAGGYGELRFEGRMWYAHRLASTQIHGPIPDGFHIDHLCRNIACCNPDHLEAVTPAENYRRNPNGLTTINRSKTNCPKGHPYAGDNLRIKPNGHRICRTCHRDAERARTRRKTA